MPEAEDSMPDGGRPPQQQIASELGDKANTLTASRDSPAENPSRHTGKFAVLSAIACTVFGAKLILIAELGSPMPLMDQWNGEAANLYMPYLHGTLSFGDLFTPHNEHRIVLTRLLTLLHLELAGEWNPRLEMILCAMVHTAFVTWLAALMMPLLAPRRRMLFACFTAIVFALPLGYENTLLGFNFHFYLPLVFGVATIICFASARPFSPRWFGGLAAAILSYLSFSSGVAAIFAAVILICVQLRANVRDRRAPEFVAIGIMLFIAAAMIAWLLTGGGPDVAFWAFVQGFLLLAGPTVIGVILIQGPTIWFCRHTLAIRPAADDRAWVAVGIAGFVAIQIAIVAYGRGTAVGSRHIDLLLPVYPVALIAIFTLADGAAGPRLRRYASKGATMWVFAVVTLMIAAGYYGFLLHAIDYAKSAQQQMVNAQDYYSTHDVEVLKRKADSPLVDVSYSDSARLAHILDDPAVRAILPPEIRPANADTAGARNHMLLKGKLAEVAGPATHGVLTLGPAVLAMGVGLLFAVGARSNRYSHPLTTSNGHSHRTFKEPR